MQKEIWRQDQEKLLYQSQNWRHFIELYWPIHKKRQCKINYAELSRKAKYASRAHLYELMTGKKKISLPVVDRLVEALKLKGEDKKFFLLLARKEFDSLQPNDLDISINQLRHKLIKQIQAAKSPELISELFSGYHIYSIYAALGSPDTGASMKELKARTSVSELILKEVLDKLIKIDYVTFDSNRFYLKNNALDLNELGTSINFKETFLMAIREIKIKAEKMENFKDDLYFHTAIPIKTGTQILLKEKLRELIIDFVNQNDVSNGDEIIHINLSAYRN